MKKKIYYHDTDAGGVVYYANYLKFLEEARTELLEEKGGSVHEMLQRGLVFVVSRQEIDYKSPAFYGDTLDFETRICGVYFARLEFDYTVRKNAGDVVCRAKTILACVDRDFKPQPIPKDLRERLKE